METGSRRPQSRFAGALAIGAAMAVAESLAAWQLGVVEPLFHALQAGVLLIAGCSLALLPGRWSGALPLAAVGLLHLRGTALEEASLATAAAVATVHTVAILVGWSRVRGSAAWTFLAAYAVQAVACARWLFPLERSEQESWQLPIGLLCATCLPLLALACAQGVARAEGKVRAVAGLLLAALGVLPPLLGESLAWAAHRRMAPAQTTAPAAASDVILIVLDTVRADRMSLHGHDRPTTPQLEELARSATVFDRAQSAGTWTLPGHASIFTGLYVSEHAAEHRPDGGTNQLSPGAVTLAERFREDGWRTACVAANADMFVEGFGLAQGFEFKWAETGVSQHLTVPWLASTLTHALAGQHARTRLGPLERDAFAPAREINRYALDWLDRTAGPEPRFLFLNYMEAHGQLRREPCAGARFGEGRSFLETDVPRYAEVMAGRIDPDPESVRLLQDWYDSQLACLDQHLGELFEELRARGIFEDALIVVTSDHGQMLGENRSFHHRSEVWEGLIRVPLIIKAPGQTRAVRCERPQQTLDLFDALPLLASGGSATDPCALPGRSDVMVTETRRHERMVELEPRRWDKNWITLRAGGTKFARADDGLLWVFEPDAPGESRRAATDTERLEFEALRGAWKADLAPPLLSEGDPAEEERRLQALRRLGYVE